MSSTRFAWHSLRYLGHDNKPVRRDVGLAHILDHYIPGTDSEVDDCGADVYAAKCGAHLHLGINIDTGTIDDVIKAGAGVCNDCMRTANSQPTSHNSQAIEYGPEPEIDE